MTHEGSSRSPKISEIGNTVKLQAKETPALLEKLKEKKEPSLGEKNPLLYPPDLADAKSIAALDLITRKLIS